MEHEFGPVLIEVAKPKLAFALIAELLHPAKTSRAIRSFVGA